VHHHRACFHCSLAHWRLRKLPSRKSWTASGNDRAWRDDGHSLSAADTAAAGAPEFLAGKFTVYVRIAFLGPVADGGSLMEPLRKIGPIGGG
jgi:hypothetical protein